jgi:hypothetical protein
VVKKDPLITYEKALLGQATGGKFPSVTFLERKKMSTKTSIKRIALVAASALAIAGFSAVPTNAALTGLATQVVTYTAPGSLGTSAAATVTGTLGTPITLTITNTFAGATAADTAADLPVLSGTAVGTGLTAVTVANATHAVVSTTGTSTQTITTGNDAIVLGQAATVAIRTLTFTPDVAGTYIFTSAATGTITTGGAITVTVASTGPTVTTTGGTSNVAGQAATVKGVGDGARFITVKAQAFAGDTAYQVSTSGVGSLYGTSPDAANVATARTVVLNATGTVASGFVVAKGGVFPSVTAMLTTDTFTFVATSSVAGTQKISITPVNATSATATLTITWGATAVLSPGASILRQTGVLTAVSDDNGLTTPNATNYSTTIDATPVSVAKTKDTNASTIEVMLLNSDGTAAIHGDSISATVAGSGLTVVNQTETAAAGTVRASSTTLNAGRNVAFVHVTSDGSAGVGTVTVSVTDGITGTTTVLGTRTVTFTGSVTTITVDATNFNIGAAGKVTGAATGARDYTKELGAALANDATVDTMPAFVIKTTDGTNAVSISLAGVPSVKSADTTVVASGTCVLDTTTSANRKLIGQGGSAGFYNCNFTAGANAASGKSVVLTFSTPSTTAGVNLTTTATVTIGSTTVASEKITTDATSYAAGQAMVVTITAKDSAGNPVADGTASPAVTANKALGTSATALAAGFYAGGSNANAASAAKSSLFAPSLGGDFILKATGTDKAATALTATASVEGDASSSLALDAANAATDAANNAYDEAQNATQAASDALAAVTALSAQVSALIATVKSLAAMVAKIKAKVKA